MNIFDSNISAIILAAGASERMGTHKALLITNQGHSLLSQQTSLLLQSGCSNITIVLGAVTDEIIREQPELLAKWAINSNWQLGQFSSLKIGLEDAIRDNPTGIIILPIDTIGIKTETVQAITETALRNPHLNAVIPEYEGRGGHPIYISKEFAKELILLDPSKPDSRLDIKLEEELEQIRLPVSDPAIITNVNTPEEWKRYKV